jgi:hypothetical protein
VAPNALSEITSALVVRLDVTTDRAARRRSAADSARATAIAHTAYSLPSLPRTEAVSTITPLTALGEVLVQIFC